MTAHTLTPSWRRVSRLRIDAIVAAHLGETRVPGNAHPAALNRQIATYLPKQVGGWSYKAIGRSITVAIIRLFTTRSNASKHCERTVPTWMHFCAI